MMSKLNKPLSSINLRKTLHIYTLIVFDLFQIIYFSLVLILIKNQTCDQSLKIYLRIYLLNLTLRFLIKMYFNLIEFKHLKVNQEGFDEKIEEEEDKVNEEVNEIDDESYLKVFYDLFKTFSWVWFFIGHFLILNLSSTCSKTSLYFSSLISFTPCYFDLIEIFLILLTLNLFLPIIRFTIKLFNLNEQNESYDELSIHQTPLILHLNKLDQIKLNYQIFKNQRKEFDFELGLSEEDDQLWIQSILDQNQNQNQNQTQNSFKHC
ncbi:hypothetical protein DFH28DRAFT_1026492 [Melampsora americana]|nr:hypothetical protein DFH28DRAFT_1026492 [Melampsora americana]